MAAPRLLLAATLLLCDTACMMQQLGAGPRPAAVVLRMTAPDSVTRKGSLVLADGDSLVLYDLEAKQRFVVRAASGMDLDIYRGQQGSLKATAKSAGKGALIGAGIGAVAGGLLGLVANTSSYWEDVNLAGSIAKGAAAGAVEGASVGAFQGALQGEAVWERITLLQLRQELCRCANPDLRRDPAVRLIP